MAISFGPNSIGGVNMRTERIIIDAKDIREVYNEFFTDETGYISDDKFEEFLRFLKIDFYDWIKGNLRQFESN